MAEDHRNLKNHVYPFLGSHPINQITSEDIERLHQRMHKTPYAANRTLSLLSMGVQKSGTMETTAQAIKSCRDIEKYQEDERERRLTNGELTLLGDVLRRVEKAGTYSPYVLAAIWLLLYTGGRLSEILTLKWSYLDSDKKRAYLPYSKTGEKTLYLNTPACQVLKTLPQIDENPYVLPGQRPGSHLVNLHRAWLEIRKLAGLNDVRLHDLRHSYASIGVDDEKLSLSMVGGLLGHVEMSTAHRYAHLADDSLKAAAESIGQRLQTALTGTDQGTGQVLPFKKRGKKSRSPE